MTVSVTTQIPIIVPANTAVLLLFLPPIRAVARQGNELIALAQTLQGRFANQLRVLRLDEVTHPEVVRSFNITRTPTFVLVRQGVERWRHEGQLAEQQLLAMLAPLVET